MFSFSGTAIALSLTLSLSFAFADELDTLQSAREAAQMRYVNEIGSGKHTTSEQQEALKKNLLGPHEQKTRNYFQSISALPTPRAVKPEELDLKSAPRRILSGMENHTEGTSSAAGHEVSSAHGNLDVEKVTLRPQFVLDGSQVPKEVEFEGAPQKPAKKAQ